MTDIRALRRQLDDSAVELTSETRAKLTGIVAEYRQKGAAAQPVIFGNHRNPQAVLLPIEIYTSLLDLSEGKPSGSTPLPHKPSATPEKRTDEGAKAPGSSLQVGASTQQLIDEIMAKWKL